MTRGHFSISQSWNFEFHKVKLLKFQSFNFDLWKNDNIAFIWNFKKNCFWDLLTFTYPPPISARSLAYQFLLISRLVLLSQFYFELGYRATLHFIPNATKFRNTNFQFVLPLKLSFKLKVGSFNKIGEFYLKPWLPRRLKQPKWPNQMLLIDQLYIKLGFLPFVSSELIRLSQLSHKRLFTDKVQNIIYL